MKMSSSHGYKEQNLCVGDQDTSFSKKNTREIKIEFGFSMKKQMSKENSVVDSIIE